MKKFILILFLILFSFSLSFSQESRTAYRIVRVSTTPTLCQAGNVYYVLDVKKYKFCTDLNTLIIVEPIPANTITGTGVSGRVTYWTGTNTVSSNSGFTFSGTGSTFDLTLGRDLIAGRQLIGQFGTITPLSDIPSLTLRRFSSTQTNNILNFQTEANASLSFFDKSGVFNGNVIGNLTGTASGNLSTNNNLSDVGDISAARDNLGLGSAAQNNTEDFEPVIVFQAPLVQDNSTPNKISIGDGFSVGSATHPSINFLGDNTTGIWSRAPGILNISITPNSGVGKPIIDLFNISTPTFRGSADFCFNWTAVNQDAIQGSDTGLCRNGIGILEVNNGTAGTLRDIKVRNLIAVNNVGTTTNDNASSGSIGEYQTAQLASGSATSLTTNTAKTITSISLTAGDWDCTGVVDFNTSVASASDFKSGTSSTNNTFGAQDTFINIPLVATGLSDVLGQNVPLTRYSLSTTTTIYLIGSSTFSAGTITAYGTIRCRRVR